MRLHDLLADPDGLALLVRLDLALDRRLRPIVESMVARKLDVALVACRDRAPSPGDSEYAIVLRGRRGGEVVVHEVITVEAGSEGERLLAGLFADAVAASVRRGTGQLDAGLEPDELADPKVGRLS